MTEPHSWDVGKALEKVCPVLTVPFLVFLNEGERIAHALGGRVFIEMSSA
jgi:hypothetical protein